MFILIKNFQNTKMCRVTEWPADYCHESRIILKKNLSKTILKKVLRAPLQQQQTGKGHFYHSSSFQCNCLF